MGSVETRGLKAEGGGEFEPGHFMALDGISFIVAGPISNVEI